MTHKRDPGHTSSSLSATGRPTRFARRLEAALLALAFLLPVASSTVLAQTSGASVARRLEVPRGATSEAYLRTSRAAGLQSEIDYLPPNVPFDADLPQTARPRALDDAFDGVAPEWRAAAAAVLALLAAAALFLLLRYRHVLAELFVADRALDRSAALPPGDPDRRVDHDLLARLRAEPDPRVGLRLLLARFLALAARENALVLRRGLTTREVLGALPGGWHHRGNLERLARQVELSVFGGREMGRDAYQDCLDLAAPLLFQVDPSGGPGVESA